MENHDLIQIDGQNYKVVSKKTGNLIGYVKEIQENPEEASFGCFLPGWEFIDRSGRTAKQAAFQLIKYVYKF